MYNGNHVTERHFIKRSQILLYFSTHPMCRHLWTWPLQDNSGIIMALIAVYRLLMLKFILAALNLQINGLIWQGWLLATTFRVELDVVSNAQAANQSRMRRECRERFPRHWLQRKLAIPACNTACACRTCRNACWDCKTRCGGENVPGIPGTCARARGPLPLQTIIWLFLRLRGNLKDR